MDGASEPRATKPARAGRDCERWESSATCSPGVSDGLASRGAIATASGAFEAITDGVTERRERNGRKAGANGDELMTSEVGP